MDKLKPPREKIDKRGKIDTSSILVIFKGLAAKLAAFLKIEDEDDQSKFFPRIKILQEMLEKGAFTFNFRRADFEAGRSKEKWEQRVAPYFKIRPPNERGKVIEFLNSIESKVQPINIFIHKNGSIYVDIDGNTRMYAAIKYEVDPRNIPVFCDNFPISGIKDVNSNTTLAAVIELAKKQAK